jgi:serine/threonine protein kinase
MFRGYEQILENFFLALFDFHIHFIIHDDLHANNIFINPNTLKVKIIDFDHAVVNELPQETFTNSEEMFLKKIQQNWNTSSVQDKRRFLELLYLQEKQLSNYFTLIPECINPYFLLESLNNDYNDDEILKYKNYIKMIKTTISKLFPYIREYFIDKYTTTVLKHYSTLPSPKYSEPEPEP